jgi:hypothetical protein
VKPDSLQNGQTRVNRGDLLRSLALRILRVDDGKKKTNKGAIKLIPKQKQRQTRKVRRGVCVDVFAWWGRVPSLCFCF